MKRLLIIALGISFIIACSTLKNIPYESNKSIDIVFNDEVIDISDIPDSTLTQDYVQRSILSLRKTGGIVLLPEGEITIESNLRMHGGIQLVGQGSDKTILKSVIAGE